MKPKKSDEEKQRQWIHERGSGLTSDFSEHGKHALKLCLPSRACHSCFLCHVPGFAAGQQVYCSSTSPTRHHHIDHDWCLYRWLSNTALQYCMGVLKIQEGVMRVLKIFVCVCLKCGAIPPLRTEPHILLTTLALAVDSRDGRMWEVGSDGRP